MHNMCRVQSDCTDRHRGREEGLTRPRLAAVILEFSGEIIHWRGPSPFHFVTVPEEQSAAIEAVSSLVTYGWGVIPVMARVGRTDFRTSLFPMGELYLVPMKRHE